MVSYTARFYCVFLFLFGFFSLCVHGCNLCVYIFIILLFCFVIFLNFLFVCKLAN